MAVTIAITSNRCRRWRTQLAWLWAAAIALVLVICSPLLAQQRVQIPLQGPTVGAVGPPPAFDSYAGSAGVTPFSQPPVVTTPQLVQPAPFAQPPAFGAQPPAFGQAAPFGPSPTFTQPGGFATQPVQPQGSLFPNGLPFAWEPGSYSFQPDNSGIVKFTKFVQQLDGEYTHLFGDNSLGDLQLNRIEVTSTFATPLTGNLDTPLLLTPGFVANFFEVGLGGPTFDEEVYEAFLDASWFPRVNEVFSAELGFRTGVWSDLEKVNDESIRLLGRGVGVVRLTPQMEVLAGVVYLDRERIKLLPVAGVRWQPSDVLDFDIVFPNPLIRRRLKTSGTTTWWVFLSGEYGGGSWTTRLFPQGVDYNDLRASLGFEFQTQRRVTGRFEVGYVFDREVFIPGVGGGSQVVLEFDDTVMLRAGINL